MTEANPLSLEKLAGALTERQRQMVLDSGPDDVTGEEGIGIELRTGADYAVAKALERRKIGHREGPGGFLPGMYWNGSLGLALRQHLQNGGGE